MSILFDCHLHTEFSGDSKASVESQIQAARAKGLSGITITDHLDWDFYVSPGYFDLDLPSYTSALKEIKRKYPFGSSFSVLCGLELGLQEHLADRHKKLLDEYEFDFVIGSIHQLDGLDPYYPDYYVDKTAEYVYRRTFDVTLDNLKAFCDIDALGHLDYMRRYVIREFGSSGMYTYKDYSDQIDAILQFIIRHDIALEINEGAFRCDLTEPNPQYDVISRYYDIGGRLITIGADAHTPEHVGLRFDEIDERLKNIGFKEYAVYKNRKPLFYPL